MDELKAVVLEKKGSKLTVLSSDGSFRHIRYKKPVDIGEEIDISKTRSISSWRIASSMVAVFLVAILGLFGWNLMLPTTAVAMISVDINPSLQLTLDRKGRVLELESLNSEGDVLLSKLSLQGEPWEDALSQIIEKSVSLEYLNSDQTWVVVGYSPIENTANLTKTGVNSENIAEKIDEVAEEKGVSPSVAVYELTQEEKVQAEEKGLSLGEYALLDSAKKAGVAVEHEIVKKTDDRVSLLEKPEIQEQLRKDKKLIKETLKTNFSGNMNSELNSKDNNEKNKDLKGKNNYKENPNHKNIKSEEFGLKNYNGKNDEKWEEILKNRSNYNQKSNNIKDIKNENEGPSRGGNIDRRKSFDEEYLSNIYNEKADFNKTQKGDRQGQNSSSDHRDKKDLKKDLKKSKKQNNFSEQNKSNSSEKGKIFNPWYSHRDEWD